MNETLRADISATQAQLPQYFIFMGTIFVLSMIKQMLLHISQSIIDLDEAYGSGLAMTGAEAG